MDKAIGWEEPHRTIETKTSLKERFLNLLSPQIKLTEEEQQTKRVIEQFLLNDNTKYRLSPISNHILLKHKEQQFYLLIHGNFIKITNENHSLTAQYRLSFIEEMRRIIYEKIEMDREAAIAEIFENEKVLMENIIEKLK